MNRAKGEAFRAKSEMKKAKRSVSECVVKTHNLWVSSGVSVHMAHVKSTREPLDLHTLEPIAP